MSDVPSCGDCGAPLGLAGICTFNRRHRRVDAASVGHRVEWTDSSRTPRWTVSVYLVRDEHVLLVRHKALGMWLPVGGGIEPGERPLSAVVREVREETGFAITAVDCLGFDEHMSGDRLHMNLSHRAEVLTRGEPRSDGSWDMHVWLCFGERPPSGTPKNVREALWKIASTGADERLDERVTMLDEVCKWLDGNAHPVAAAALFEARDAFLLPLARAAASESDAGRRAAEQRARGERACLDKATPRTEEWCVICKREPKDHTSEEYARCMRACGLEPRAANPRPFKHAVLVCEAHALETHEHCEEMELMLNEVPGNFCEGESDAPYEAVRRLRLAYEELANEERRSETARADDPPWVRAPDVWNAAVAQAADLIEWRVKHGTDPRILAGLVRDTRTLTDEKGGA